MSGRLLASVSGLALLAASSAVLPGEALAGDEVAADPAQTSKPAVSGINGKIEAMRGDLDGEGLWAATGSVAAPLGHSFGVQIDAIGADYSAEPTWGGGAHLFWRDPDLGMLGGVASHVDIGGTEIHRFGAEAEAYFGPTTVGLTGGWQNGESLRTGWGGLDLRYYPIDNLTLEAGASAASDERTGHLGFEWQPLSGAFSGLSLFADGAYGTHDYNQALGGIRFYFGAGEKSLKRRHREDDPINLMVEGVSGAVAASTASATGSLGGSNSSSSGSSGSSGCFIAGTLVLMADGSLKPIEDVQVGDQLAGQDDAENEVLELKRPLLGDRKLYGINGGGGFVTHSHPFMTAEGWKSIDPAATAEENPGLKVGGLAVGDVLVTHNGTVKVAAIEAQIANAATQLYNFTVSGNSTYFVQEPGGGDIPRPQQGRPPTSTSSTTRAPVTDLFLVHNKGAGGGGGGGGCFIVGTMVLMADGTARAIENVAVGDRLAGGDSTVNEVLELKRPLLKSVRLYGINGGPAFVTDSHPFMTQAGWKSIDPAATAKENPDIKVGKLAVDDVLVARGDTVKVASIEPQAVDVGTQLYNFSVSGNRTYFVKDPKTGDFLLVHNK